MHYLYMLLTHAVDAPYHSTLSTSPVNTPYQCTLSRHIINNCYQHPTNTCQPITATPLSLPEQQTVFIATCICTSSPTNTPTYPPPSPYQHPAYYQQTESNATCISTSSPLVIPPPLYQHPAYYQQTVSSATCISISSGRGTDMPRPTSRDTSWRTGLTSQGAHCRIQVGRY